jgi:hypothetical protein
MILHGRAIVCIALAVVLAGCAGRYFENAGDPPLVSRYTLDTLPQKEFWTGIVFNGAKVGFSRLRIDALPDSSLYRIESESALRLRVLGFDKHLDLHSIDTVNADLSLVSLRYDHRIDGSELHLSGRIQDHALEVEILAGASKSSQHLPLDGKVYPTTALALYPVLAGLEVGKQHALTVYNGEVQKLGEAVQRVEGWERSVLFDGPAFKVTTTMLGLSSTAWIDRRGRPLLELGLNGVLVSALEDETTARNYLAAAALNKDDVVMQWSLVKVDAPIAGALQLSRLSVSLAAPAPLQPLSDTRQQCRKSQAEWICEIDASQRSAPQGDNAKYLVSSLTVQSRDTSIALLARQIAPAGMQTEARVDAILAWMEANIRKEAADVFTARDVLDGRRAECQGHTYLFSALARSSGIPTRVINGLVYSEEYGGFLYHTWAESLIDGLWRAVDPTFGQREADATHIALVEGEELGDLVPLTDWVGKTRIRVLGVNR